MRWHSVVDEVVREYALMSMGLNDMVTPALRHRHLGEVDLRYNTRSMDVYRHLPFEAPGSYYDIQKNLGFDVCTLLKKAGCQNIRGL